ncbi:MAG TPA: ABC transporter permease [Bryobacteraceae bacterium]|nr:ABC transporter permease [Bryobacteraceae bacterium]
MWWRRPKSREMDLERELCAHLELEAEEQQQSGLDPEQAHYAARRALGNAALIKEQVREVWGWALWDIFVQEIRYALRTLGRSPGFTATAVLTLALGIGASTAVFTVVDSVILKPLAYHNSGQLVQASERVRFLSLEPLGPNPRHVDLWQKRATDFSGLTLLRYRAAGLSQGSGHPRLIGAVTCLPNLFDILQVQALLGRVFLPEDGVKGHDNVAVLTYSLWQSLFHGDANVLNRTIRIDDTPRVVVGILPERFHFPNANALRTILSRPPVSGTPDPAVFLPVALDLTQFSWNGDYGNWVSLGRLKPGITAGRAEAQLTAIDGEVIQEMPANETHLESKLTAAVQPMQEAVVSDSRTGLWLLMAAVAGLMLLACLNLANAQLGRAMARRREAAVRTALGATKWRLVWNALAENLLLAAIGGATGVLLAFAALDLFRRYPPVDLPRLAEVHLNFSVLAFSVLVVVSASLLSGLLPAMRLASSDPQESLQQSTSRTLGNRQHTKLRTWLIGVQVFGCAALLLVTGLFSKSLLYLLNQDRGFQTGHVAVAEVRLTPNAYGTDQSRAVFDEAVLANLRAIPAVQAAGLVSAMPLEGVSWIEPLIRTDRPKQEGPLINLRWVSPGYFEATRQRLLAGRFFEDRDRGRNNVVLSEGEAKALWGNEDPIGGQVRVRNQTRTVIGVVADSRSTSLKSAPARMAYLHYADQPPFATFFMARSARAADTLVPEMRRAIWKYSPDVTIARVKTFDSQVMDSLAPERFQTSVLLAFGIAALLLAMLGIYGVLSYSVVTRKQEIGVRMALGATRRRVYTLTMSEASVPVIVGLAAGLLAGILAEGAVRTLLYGIQRVDPMVIATVAVLFLLAAAAAAFPPARRAASVDPMDALRSE